MIQLILLQDIEKFLYAYRDYKQTHVGVMTYILKRIRPFMAVQILWF